MKTQINRRQFLALTLALTWAGAFPLTGCGSGSGGNNAYTATLLLPAGFKSSNAFGTSGKAQVGSGVINASTALHALLWSGTASSVVDLHPARFAESDARGVSGNAQVGAAGLILYNAKALHALLWTGTAASFIDLNPTGFSGSQALGVSGNTQVGFGYPAASSDMLHALLWTGTAASVVDLHSYTTGLLSNGVAINPVLSKATAVDSNGNIVGFVKDANNIYYPVLWTKN